MDEEEPTMDFGDSGLGPSGSEVTLPELGPALKAAPSSTLLMRETKNSKPKAAVTKITRKIRGCDIQRLWSEQSKIRQELESGRPYQAQGLLQLECQLNSFMAELEDRYAKAESVILDLAKELVRTAQEVESINCQGASVEERLERLESKMCQDAPRVTFEEPKKDELFHLDVADVGTQLLTGPPRSPSEVAHGRREAATWSGFAAPGELLQRTQEKLAARPQTLPVVAAKVPADIAAHRKLLETAASKAISDAFSEATLQLRALSSELMSSMQKATYLDIEAKKKELHHELQGAIGALRQATESAAASASVASAASTGQGPGKLEAGQGAAPVVLSIPSNHMAEGTFLGENFCDANAVGQESPKARVAKRRPSQRLLGALACLGVVRTADDDR